MAGATVAGDQVASRSCLIRELSQAVNLPALCYLNSERYPFLLRSSASGPDLARFDILFAFPGETLELAPDGTLSGPGAARAGGFLSALDGWWEATGAEQGELPDLPDLPFTGGWFLYLGYELAAEIEPGLSLPVDSSLPVAFATRVPVAVIVDRVVDRAWVVAEATHAGCIDEVEADVALATEIPERDSLQTELTEDSPAEFISAVDRARAYIAAGDIFQANLSRRWSGLTEPALHPVDMFLRLSAANPAPFSGLLMRPDFSLASSSPERLVRRRGLRLDTRPIAGTRPHNETPEKTADRKRELLADRKERAEHIMLIDLERNDLGRIAIPGSVHVNELMTLESYATVHHIVSNVEAVMRADITPGQLIRAVFPGGTITGCPKVRCMEIIAELEGSGRGAYTGSMGYLNHDGSMDLNILIRTMVRSGEQLSFRAGAGIVSDSVAEKELDETRAKARGMLYALQGRGG